MVTIKTYLYFAIAYFWIRKFFKETEISRKMIGLLVALTFLGVLVKLSIKIDPDQNQKIVHNVSITQNHFCLTLLNYAQDLNEKSAVELLSNSCATDSGFTQDLFALSFLDSIRSSSKNIKSLIILDYEPSSFVSSIFLAKTLPDVRIETASMNLKITQTVSFISPIFFKSKWTSTFIPELTSKYPIILLSVSHPALFVDAIKTVERHATSDATFYVRFSSPVVGTIKSVPIPNGFQLVEGISLPQIVLRKK